MKLLINNHVLGDANDPYIYKIPYEDSELGDIKIHNWHMRKIMLHFGEFINCCLLNSEEERDKWQVLYSKYDVISVAIQAWHNFSDEAIDKLQLIIFKIWCH